jgi:hypothetical protein
MELAKDPGLNTVFKEVLYGLKLKFLFQLLLKKKFARSYGAKYHLKPRFYS